MRMRVIPLFVFIMALVSFGVHAEKLAEISAPENGGSTETMPPPPEGAPSPCTSIDLSGPDCNSGDWLGPPSAEQMNLNHNMPPAPPDSKDIYSDDRGRIPPPPPGYENMTGPGEPPRP